MPVARDNGIKAIIGVDAGVTTGLAWGVFNPALRDRTSLWQALARGRRTGWAEIGGTGDILADATSATRKVLDVIADWNMGDLGIGVLDVLVVIEDFQIRRDLIGGTGRDKLAPVFVTGLMMGGLAGIGWGSTVKLVSPSVSKAKATDDRLKRLGQATSGRRGWIRGKRHARDAWRLVAVGLDQTP